MTFQDRLIRALGELLFANLQAQEHIERLMQENAKAQENGRVEVTPDERRG